jgi:hypothetical protein
MAGTPHFGCRACAMDSDGDNRIVFSPNCHGTRRPRPALPSPRPTASHQRALRRERRTHRPQQHLCAAAAESRSLHLARAPRDPLPRRQVLAEGDLQGQRLQRQRQRGAAGRRGGAVQRRQDPARRLPAGGRAAGRVARQGSAGRVRLFRQQPRRQPRHDGLAGARAGRQRRPRFAVRHLAQLGPAVTAAGAPQSPPVRRWCTSSRPTRAPRRSARCWMPRRRPRARARPAPTRRPAARPAFGRDDNGASALDAFLGLDGGLLGKPAAAPT